MIANSFLLSLILSIEAVAAPSPCREPIPRTRPCAPSSSEAAKVIASIEEAMAAHRKLQAFAAAEWKDRFFLRPGDFSQLEEWEASKYALFSARRQAKRHFDAAIYAAAQTYGIRPSVPSRVLTEPPMEGVELGWSPRAWLDEGSVYRVHDRDGTYHFLPGLRADAGEVSGIRSNGDILLNVSIFERAANSADPMDFALILAFETARYDGVATGKSPTTTQRKAIEAEIAAARAFGAPQKQIDKLNDEYRSLVNGVSDRPLPVLTDYFQHVRLSNVWQGELEAQRQRLQDNLNSQRALREEQERETRRREQVEANIPPEQRELARINAQYMAALAEAFCDTPLLADARGQAIHEQWSSVVQDAEPPSTPLDIDDMKFEGTCTQYVVNQALYAKTIGRNSKTSEWLSFAVREGILRAKGAAPLFERIRAATPPPPPPQSTPPSEGTWSPDPVVEEPTANPIPHCRYHDWCKEPKQKPRDQ